MRLIKYVQSHCDILYAAGADPDGELGEDHDPETHLIPLILFAADGKRENITIFGSDYDTPDGTCIHDYIHVTDLAQAHLLALKNIERNETSTAYNLGNGNGYSVQEVINAASRITGKDISTVMGIRRPGDPSRLVGDATRAIEELGWNPEYAELDKIIETAWQWQQNPNI